MIDGLITESQGLVQLQKLLIRFMVDIPYRIELLQSLSDINLKQQLAKFWADRKQKYAHSSDDVAWHQAGKDLVTLVSLATGTEAAVQAGKVAVKGLVKYTSKVLVKAEELVGKDYRLAEESGTLVARKGDELIVLSNEEMAGIKGGSANAAGTLDDIVDEAQLAELVKDIKYQVGPQLPKDIAKTFENLQYSNRKLPLNERFFKYHGTNNRTGRKFAWYTNKKYGSELELRQRLAIKEEWGIQIEYISEFDVPAGTWVSEGKAASQGIGYPGGDYQAVILNTPNAWLIRTDKAFK